MSHWKSLKNKERFFFHVTSWLGFCHEGMKSSAWKFMNLCSSSTYTGFPPVPHTYTLHAAHITTIRFICVDFAHVYLHCWLLHCYLYWYFPVHWYWYCTFHAAYCKCSVYLKSFYNILVLQIFLFFFFFFFFLLLISYRYICFFKCVYYNTSFDFDIITDCWKYIVDFRSICDWPQSKNLCPLS